MNGLSMSFHEFHRSLQLMILHNVQVVYEKGLLISRFNSLVNGI